MPESVMFVSECHVDTALTRALLLGRLEFINHQHGITSVANVLQSQAATDRGPRFVVGMVDRDKKFADVKYLRHFTQVVKSRTSSNCRYHIYRHSKHLSHFLIVLEPACDTWIFEAAHAAGLDLSILGLPDSLSGFIAMVKGEDAED